VRRHASHAEADAELLVAPSRNRWCAFQRGFENRFERVRAQYRGVLQLALEHRRGFVIGFLAFVAASFLLVPMLGRNFFPRSIRGRS